MTTFEISGDTVTGGADDAHGDAFHNRIQALEASAKEVGKSLGMATVDACYLKGESISYGFRFAASSEEKFDVMGAEKGEAIAVNVLIEKLG